MNLIKKTMPLFISLIAVMSLSAMADGNQLQSFRCKAAIAGGVPGTSSEIDIKQEIHFFANDKEDADGQANLWLEDYLQEISALRSLPNAMFANVDCRAAL